MIGMIIKSLDSFVVFSDVVVQLGGRHEIYGVNEGDYECFARVLSSSVAELLGGDNSEEVCPLSSSLIEVNKKILEYR
jgi:hypothetical protein